MRKFFGGRIRRRWYGGMKGALSLSVIKAFSDSLSYHLPSPAPCIGIRDVLMPLEEGCVFAGECMGKGVSGGGVCRRGW